MRMIARAIVPALLVALALAPVAGADTIYTYTGDYFGTQLGQPTVAGMYTTADRITGSFTVADGFVPGFTSGGAAFTGGGLLQAANGDYSPAPSVSGVLSYSFTDGHQTLTQANSTAIMYLAIPTEALNLTDGGCSPCLYRYRLGASWPDGFRPGSWNIYIGTPTSRITTYLFGDRYDRAILDAANFGMNGQAVGPSDGSHLGTWTVQTVPEPPTMVLVAAGLLAVGGGLWRRRRSI